MSETPKRDDPEVIVVGSCNMDLIAYAPRLPLVGETLHGNKFKMGFGGKGANQCVAASKLSASTAMVAKVGFDDYGHSFIKQFRKCNVLTDHVTQTDEACTGVAPITVGDDGNNSIVIVSGANMLLSASDVDAAKSMFKTAKVLVCQLEISRSTTLYALKEAKEAGVLTIFNPAPAPTEPLEDEFYAYSDVFCPNETEASILTGIEVQDIESAKSAAAVLVGKGCKCLVITLGKLGCVLAEHGKDPHHIPVPDSNVNVVDTTGAGDAFIGSLAFYYAKFAELPLKDKIQRACLIASQSVTREGPQSSFFERAELPEHIFQM